MTFYYYIVTNYYRHSGPEVKTLRTDRPIQVNALRSHGNRKVYSVNSQRLLKNGKWTKGYNFYIFDAYREVTKEEAEAL